MRGSSGAFQGPDTVERGRRFIRKDGTFFDVLYSSSALKAGSEVAGLVVVFRDITERKKIEAALLRSEEGLCSANEDLKHFSYAASHDLQEPLRMMMSYTQLLAREYKGRLDANADKFIAHAVDGAARMEALLRDLREYWSVNEQRVETLVRVDTNRVLEKALANLEMRARESGAVVTQDSLPTVTAEELPFTLLFQNLIGNALKYRWPDRRASASPWHGRTAPGIFQCRATASASTQGGWKRFLRPSSASTAAKPRAPASVSPCARKSWSGTGKNLGRIDGGAGVRFSFHASRQRRRRMNPAKIVLIEDNPGDVFLFEMAMKENGIACANSRDSTTARRRSR